MKIRLSPISPRVSVKPAETSPIQCRAGFEGLDVAGQAARAETLHRAHSIWLGNGCPENSALDDWLKAEAEVLRES